MIAGIEWVAALSPTAIVSIVFYFVLARQNKRIDEMQTKEMAIQVEKGLEKELKGNKVSLNKLFDKAEEAHVAQAEMAKDIRWLVSEIKNGGVK